jgi:hypothetical protein
MMACLEVDDEDTHEREREREEGTKSDQRHSIHASSGTEFTCRIYGMF